MLLLLLACATPPPVDTAADWPACTATGPLDDALTLPDVQALGTHNSYHVAPDVVLDPSHDYTQPPLDQQADLGVRAFELDVHLDDDGVFEVFHLPAIDPESTCATLGDCLGVLAGWSAAHPCHTPFTVWIEPKDDLDAAVDGLQPLAGHLTELDDAIAAAWPPARTLTPDDLRGRHATLPEAVADGWPALAELRGHALFALLDSGDARAEYLSGSDVLAGRTLFVDADSDADPFAATFKIDDAGAESDRVQDLVAAGFLVTSNVDAAADDDATNAASLAAALAAGPQNLASDRPAPVEGSGYVAALPGGSPRCLPERGHSCGPADLEP